MTDQNPYQAPQAKLDQPAAAGKIGEPRALPTGRGLDWLTEGFELFQRAAGMWVVNTILFFVLISLLSLAPFGGILMPLVVGGMMLGCRDLDEGRGELEVSHLFAGFQHRTGQLVGLGVIYVLLSLVVTVIMMLGFMSVGFANMQLDAQMMGPSQFLGLLVGMLLATLLMVPIVMLFWFAPAIVILNEDIGIFDAMKLSFRGCMRNILPFTLYSIVVFILMIVATIPFGLGWLILTPVLFASVYVGYKQIFLTEVGQQAA